MNIRDLKYLVSVADLKSFTQAAKTCNVSQPTLSGQIKKIETMLKVQIFERDTKTVRLTSAGREIIDSARRALDEINDIYAIGKMAQDPLTGTLRIGAFPTLSPYLFPQIIPALNKRYPNLRLILFEEKTDALIRKLKSGELDAAFLALPLHESNLESATLFDDEFYIAVPEDHELAGCPQIGQRILREHNLLLLEEGHCMRDQALDICDLYDLAEEPDFRATSLETLRQMVRAGIGVTIMPKIAVHDDEGIKYIPIKDPAPKRSIALVWRKTSVRKATFKTIAAAVQDIVKL